jgi:membrane protein
VAAFDGAASTAEGARAARPASTRQGDPPPERHHAPRGFLREAGNFAWRVYQKAGEDNIFFLAGAIAFNVLVAVVPLILAVLSVAGMVLANRTADPAGVVLRYVNEILPGALSVATDLRAGLNDLISQSGGLLSLSTLFFIWLATRLVGTLRTALREIFDVRQNRGIVAGKIFDIQMVLAAGTLLAINVALTVVIGVLAERGIAFLGIAPTHLEAWTRIYLTAAGVLSLWFMFVLMYRYLPPRRIPWRIATISATFTAVLFELMKAAFGWYVSSIADYRTAYGNFATGIVLFLWIYYMAVVFVLGGQVGHVAAQRRARRRQKERLG